MLFVYLIDRQSVEIKKTSSVEKWAERVSKLQPDIRAPIGLIFFASAFFLFVVVCIWTVPHLAMSLTAVSTIVPSMVIISLMGMVFFTTLIPLLHQHPVYHWTLISLILFACTLPFLLDSPFNANMILMVPLIVFLSMIISTFPLALMRLLAGWRLTSHDACTIIRRPISITGIFCFMIVFGAFLAIMVAITSYQSQHTSEFRNVPFMTAPMFTLAMFLFGVGLIHLPIFILGLRLEFNSVAFWVVVSLFWLIPVFLITVLSSFAGGPMPVEEFLLLTFNIGLSGFGYASMVLIVRSCGYRLMFVPVTVRRLLEDPDEEIDPLQ